MRWDYFVRLVEVVVVKSSGGGGGEESNKTSQRKQRGVRPLAELGKSLAPADPVIGQFVAQVLV